MNTKQTSSRSRTLIFALSVSLAIPGVISAQESKWNLRFRGAVVSSDEAFSVDNSSDGSTIAGGNAAPGVGVAVERRFSDRYGLELATFYAKVPDTDVTNTSGQQTEVDEGPSFIPIAASLNIHLTPDRKVDFYVAPTLAFVSFGDFELEVDSQTSAYETDSEFAWGASIGADIKLGDRWSLNSAVSYFDVDMEVSEVGSPSAPVVTQFDPFIVSVGATLKF